MPTRDIPDQWDLAKITAPGTAPTITSIFNFSAEALGELKTWLESAGLNVPITQIIGFSQFTAQSASVATSQTTASTAYTDLATVGPSLTGLSDGNYLVIVSALTRNNTSGFNALMGPGINGALPPDDSASAAAGFDTVDAGWTVSAFSLQKLAAGGNNTITAKYRVNGASTGTFTYRNLIALRYSNL